jgi:hypothetical protein
LHERYSKPKASKPKASKPKASGLTHGVVQETSNQWIAARLC